MTYTVLVSGASAPAGRSMVDALQGESVQVLACDCGPVPTGIGLPLKQCFQVHRGDDVEFVGDLVTLCVQHDVDMLVPTGPVDQQSVARARTLFERLGASVWIAPEQVTSAQAHRVLQLDERRRTRSTVSEWLWRLASLGQAQSRPQV